MRFYGAFFKSIGPRPYRKTLGFAHVLANMGWGESRELSILACAWRNQIEDIRPDAMINDHSPTALLASRGLDFPVKRIVLGSGFCCPPDTFPLPAFATDEAPDMDTVREDEQLVLRRANHVLSQWGRAPLRRLGSSTAAA